MGKSYTYIHQREEHGRMMLDLIDNGPLVYPTVEENGQTRPKKYFKLTEAQQLQDDCDVQEINIILHSLPPDVYTLVNHQEAAKDIWDRVKMLTKGTELSYQERECRLYNLFDKVAHVLGETLYEYYWRFSQLINGMHTIRMAMQQVQVNTKFLNALLSEWSKFITDVNLAKSLYTTTYDQLYAYFSQNERHANKVHINRERYPDSLAFVANSPTLYNPSHSPQHSGNKGIVTTLKGNVTVGPSRVIKVISVKEKGIWRDNPGISEASVAQQTIPQNSVFQTDDLDAYDSDYSQMDDLIRDRNAKLTAFQQEIDTLKETLSNYRIQPRLYDGSDITKEHAVIFVIDDDETLILEEESRSKMLDKQNNPISIEKKIKISSIDYSKLNKIKEDFGKRFVTKKALSAEQALWLKHLSISETPVTLHTPVRIKAPSKLPKCLELELELFKKKDFIEKEAYDKLVKSYSNLEKHRISLELATQLNQEMFQRENSGENLNAPTFNQLFEINELKSQSQEKETVIKKLKERIKSLSGKDSVENIKKDIDEIETINIELEHRMFKLDIKPISHRLKNNRDANEELLVYASQTCLNSPKPSEKLIVVTSINKDKRVRFTEPVTSSNNIAKQTDSLKTKDSNKPLLTSIGVKPTISASRSKPSGNTKNNRITRPPRRNQKNKVEDHPRKVKSSLNKMNYIFEPISNALVKHSMKNAKFESICTICNKCLFDVNRDMCLVDFMNDVNVRSRSKSKRNKKRKAWKPTGKVFTNVGYK
nr:hypothetical protein [Tanacetum cinerariifolium]